MKKVSIIIIFLLAVQYINAQATSDKDKFINEFTSCFALKTSFPLEPLLDDDFTMMGQKMPISLKVFQAILLQLNDTIDSTQYITTVGNGEKTITHDVFFHQKKRMVTFQLTPAEKIKAITIEGIGAETRKPSEMATVQTKNIPNTIQIPFTLHNNLPIVTVKVNGEDRNFFFDSGAPTVLLNSKYYNNTASMFTVSGPKGVSGQEISTNIQTISAFEFAELKAENLEVMCSDLSQLESSDGEKTILIHGLIGYSFIKDFDIMYDYANQNITLISKNYVAQFIDKLKADDAIKSSVAMMQVKHIPYVTITINSEEYLMGIDCGASSNLLSDKKFERVKNSLTNVETAILRGGDTKGVKRTKGQVKEMKIAGIKFTDVLTIFSSIDHITASVDIALDGLIGYPILSKQKCMISYHTNSLLFLR